MRFFFYGTLLDADIRRLVLGRGALGLAVEPATLGGYRRVSLRRRSYPAVVPDPLGSVAGCLARGLDAGAAERLAAFEGGEYEPVLCAVSTEVSTGVSTGVGRTLPAWVFVAGGAAVLSTMPWDFATWRRRHKRAFQRRLCRRRNGIG